MFVFRRRCIEGTGGVLIVKIGMLFSKEDVERKCKVC